MKNLINDVKELVREEYARASVVNGETLHSNHESYAVILEELEEAEHEDKIFRNTLNVFWEMVKHDESAYTAVLEQMERVAVRAAAEWIQVAGVCHKAGLGRSQHE